MTNVVFTKDHLQEVVDHFMQQDAFAFDVEAMGENRGVPTKATLSWMGIATHGLTAVIPFGHPNGNRLLSKATRKKNPVTKKFDPIPAKYDAPPQQLRPSEVFSALEPLFFSDRIKIAHNATYDLISTAKYWGEIAPPEYSDTIVLQWLLDENMKQKGLKELVKRYYKVDYDQENVGKCVEAHPFKKVAHYQFMDAKYTWMLWKRFQRQIEIQGLTKIRDLEMDVLGVLLDMGVEGAPVDVEAMKALESDLSERIVEIEARVYQAAGKIFNINSNPQKQNLLWGPKDDGGQGLKPRKLTDGGKKKQKEGKEVGPTDYSTDAESLEYYPKNPLASTLLEYAEVNKLLGTYVRGYLGDPEDKDKPCIIFDDRIHADFVQYGTVTGRFSCRAPNLQNIPRPGTELGKKVRGLFVAPPGHKLIVADYGQIELVVLAHYLGAGRLYEGFMEGIDPHTMTAAGVVKKDPADVTPDERQRFGKSINFAVVYGAGPDKVAAMASITTKEAKKFLGIHQDSFPEIYQFKDAVVNRARTRKPPHIVTLLGRKRRLPTIMSSDWGLRGYAERQAVNSLIQGSSADLIKLAMIRLNNAVPTDMRLILSVHDELVTICPTDKVEEGSAIVREAMLGDGISRLLKTPMTSDLKVVDRWSEAK